MPFIAQFYWCLFILDEVVRFDWFYLVENAKYRRNLFESDALNIRFECTRSIAANAFELTNWLGHSFFFFSHSFHQFENENLFIYFLFAIIHRQSKLFVNVLRLWDSLCIDTTLIIHVHGHVQMKHGYLLVVSEWNCWMTSISSCLRNILINFICSELKYTLKCIFQAEWNENHHSEPLLMKGIRLWESLNQQYCCNNQIIFCLIGNIIWTIFCSKPLKICRYAFYAIIPWCSNFKCLLPTKELQLRLFGKMNRTGDSIERPIQIHSTNFIQISNKGIGILIQSGIIPLAFRLGWWLMWKRNRIIIQTLVMKHRKVSVPMRLMVSK